MIKFRINIKQVNKQIIILTYLKWLNYKGLLFELLKEILTIVKYK